MFTIGCIASSAAASNPFQVFDNNITAGFYTNSSPENYTSSGLSLNGQILFDNNVWLNLLVTDQLALDYSNHSNANVSLTLNNASANSYEVMGGYAFAVGNSYNFIPHIGFSYDTQLTTVNADSIQQFIINDPSFNFSLGLKQEYILLPARLKLAADLNFASAYHQAVLPTNTEGSLGHYDYTNYSILIKPAIQWNVTKRFTMLAFYQFSYTFGQTPNVPNIYFPNAGINTNQFLSNNYVQNSVGLNFGFVF